MELLFLFFIMCLNYYKIKSKKVIIIAYFLTFSIYYFNFSITIEEIFLFHYQFYST